MSADLYLTGDAGADSFTIVRSGSSDLIYHNQPVTGLPTSTVDLSTLDAINIFGNGGADTVNVDYSGGDPIPGSLNIYAGGGSVQSTLIVTGVAAGTGNLPNYTLSTGVLTIANSAIDDTIDFANVDQFDLFDSAGGSLTVAGGSPTFDQDLGSAGGSVDVTIDSGASIAFGVTQHLDNLTIYSGGTGNMLPAGGQLLDTNTLTVDGVLDLANNDLIVNTPTTTAMTTLQEQVAIGVTDAASGGGIGTTQGLIYSSTAATDGLTLGVAPAADISLTTLDGQTVQSGSLVVRYTLPGDANLDGTVDSSDIDILSSNYGSNIGNIPSWWKGDFNYDGQVDFSDFTAIAQTYGQSTGTVPTEVTVGVPYTLTFPTPTVGTATRWDVNWGDGTFNSYDPYTTSASHVFTTIGTALVRFEAVTYDPTAGYGVYRAPAQPLVITADGVTATPLSITATASTDTFYVGSDDSGDTIITKTTAAGITTTVADEPTADILSLSITGNAANVTIDFDNPDPLPAAGIFSDAANIELDGERAGLDSLVNTGTAALLGNDTIRYPATTQLIDEVNSFTILALAGSTTLKAVPTGSDVTVATGATLLINGSQSLNSLTIEPGGTAREISPVTTLGATVLNIFTLTLDDTDAQGDPGAVLDLGNGDLITKYTNILDVRSWLAAGYDSGFWDGQSTTSGINPAAIVSSGAASDPYLIKSLGYAEIGTATGTLDLSSFDGKAVSAGDVVVALTYYGDANLDRLVNDSDSELFGASPDDVVTEKLIGWTSGDFNYDGNVDGSDLDLLNSSSSILTTLAAGTPTVFLTNTTAIPVTGGGAIAVTSLSTSDGSLPSNVTVNSVSNLTTHAVVTGSFSVTVVTPGAPGQPETVTISVNASLPPGDYLVQLSVPPDGVKSFIVKKPL